MINQEIRYQMPVIDCHVHLNSYDKINKTGKKFLSIEERLGSLIESMHDNGIDYSLILSSYKVDADRPSTSKILDSYLSFIRKLELNQESLELLMFKNAKSVFGL